MCMSSLAARRSPLSDLLWKTRDLVLGLPEEAGTLQEKWLTCPIVVAGLFRTSSGIGQSARACAAGLQKQGLDPVCVDLSEPFNQTSISSAHNLRKYRPGGRGTVIIHLNPPEFERACFLLGLFRGHGCRVIGYWAYELERVPDLWVRQSRLASEIWVPSNFTACAVTKAIDRPVKVVPHYVPEAAEDKVSASAPENRPITCLAMADANSSFDRKNLSGVLAIWSKAKMKRPAQLIIKVQNAERFPDFYREFLAVASRDSRITLLSESMEEGALKQLMKQAQILISPHRSEGFGLVIAEAMANGSAVIATGWSGNLDLSAPGAQVLLDYALVPVTDAFGVYTGLSSVHWALADIDQAASWLERLVHDDDARVRMGESARIAARRFATGKPYLDALGFT